MAEVQDVRGVAHRRVDIVGHHDDGDVVAEVHKLDEIIQLPRRDRVEAGHRLVEQQELLRGAQGARQQHALLLPARQLLIAPVPQLLDAHALHVPVGAGAVLRVVVQAAAQGIEAAGEHDLPDAGRKIPLDLGLLRQVADLGALQAVAEADRPLLRGLEAQKPLDQRGLAGAVLADHAEIIPRVQREVHALQHGRAVIGKAQVFTLQNGHQPSASFSASALRRISSR